MAFLPKTISEHIDCLARLTDAPQSFVLQVKELFSRKGISLGEDAGPYLDALDEAFRREEAIRAQTARSRNDIARLQENFRRIGESYDKQLAELKRFRSELPRRAKPRATRKAQGKSSRFEVAIPGDHRTYVTRTEREELPLVPGPQDVQ